MKRRTEIWQLVSISKSMLIAIMAAVAEATGMVEVAIAIVLMLISIRVLPISVLKNTLSSQLGSQLLRLDPDGSL